MQKGQPWEREEHGYSGGPSSASSGSKEEWVLEASHGTCSEADSVLDPRMLCPFPQLMASHPGRLYMVEGRDSLPGPMELCCFVSVQEGPLKIYWLHSHKETNVLSGMSIVRATSEMGSAHTCGPRTCCFKGTAHKLFCPSSQASERSIYRGQSWDVTFTEHA